MRKLSMLFSALVILSLVAAPLSAAFAAGAVKKHDLTVSVVSINAEAKTMTFKMDTGEEKTAPVIGQAINKIKDVKAGEKVTITCTDKENGEHEGISDIKAAAAPKA